MICKNCGKENKNTNIRCEYCGTGFYEFNDYGNPIIEDESIKLKTSTFRIIVNIFLGFILFPIMFSGALLFGIGAYDIVPKFIESFGYQKAQGTLINYKNCNRSNQEDYCDGIYEYNVNGKAYTGSPDEKRNKDGFDKYITVWYNEKTPEDYVIYDDVFFIFLLIGFCLVSIPLAIFIVVNVIFKKVEKKEKEKEQKQKTM